MNNKNLLILILIILAITGSIILYTRQGVERPVEEPVVCETDTKLCPDGSYVVRVPPECKFLLCPGEDEGILISSPKRNEAIVSPLNIEGEAKGPWFFEAEFTAELYDADNNFLGLAILTAQDDWMTENFVPFEGELTFSQPATSLGTLKFLSANPSGLPENQKVFEMPTLFEETPLREISLYYYNAELDKDDSGNIKCSRDGLEAIKREIPVTKTPIQDVIHLLLRGKENLTQEDINRGITTEYPLEGFTLLEANFKEDGTLILAFDDPQNKTSGGSCRVGILWFQIEATAKQFSGVKEVQFLPNELFQP